MAIGLANGTTLTFGTSGWTCQLVDFNVSGITREKIKTSHMGTEDFHTYLLALLSEPGELGLTVNYDPASSPPINAVAETITIAPAGGANTISGSGGITSFDLNGEVDGLMQADITVSWLGEVTFS